MKYIFTVLLALSLSQSEGFLANEQDRRQSYVLIPEPPAPVLNKLTGTLVELECQAIGSPPPTVQWFKGNRSLTENESFDNVRPKGMARVRSRLAINSVLPVHEDTYTCLAKSGSKIASANGTFYVSPNEVSNKEFSQALTDKLRAARNQPRIILYDTFYMSYVGRDIVLQCKAIGNPRPTISWVELKENADGRKLSVSANGDLTLHNISGDDMGGYMCIASNNLGRDNITTFVYPVALRKRKVL